MKSLLSTLLLCGVAAFASAQTSVSDYVPGAVENGVVYFLPKTALQVDIEIEKKTYKPGEFARYGERYLGRSCRRRYGMDHEEDIVEAARCA